MRTIGNLGECDHNIIEITVIRKGRHDVSKIKTLGFKRSGFNQFREIAGKVLWVDRLKVVRSRKPAVPKIQHWRLNKKLLQHSGKMRKTYWRPTWLHNKLRYLKIKKGSIQSMKKEKDTMEVD